MPSSGPARTPHLPACLPAVLMTAMMSVPWLLPSAYPRDCRYSTLLQITTGQEDVDEVISRDIHRTFPEYSLFAFEQVTLHTRLNARPAGWLQLVLPPRPPARWH